MALYQLILAYDGTDFSGFQRQGKVRTVQKVIETTLCSLGWQEKTILFAGRTDAGVHASGQVVTFSLDWHHSLANLQSALNAKLPVDVSVLSICKTEAEFHPRYDASSRTYTYSIYHLPARQPLLERYAWHIWPPLDGNRLNDAAKAFIGQHDFSSFGRAMKKGSSTMREVFISQWESTVFGWKYTVEANAFLYHMVRRLVYTQVQVSKEKLDLAVLKSGLTNLTNVKPGLAPPNGLVLTQVKYRNGKQGIVVEEQNLEDLAY